MRSVLRPGTLTLGTLTLSPERQSAQMSKITNDGTGCLIAVPVWQQWASNG